MTQVREAVQSLRTLATISVLFQGTVKEFQQSFQGLSILLIVAVLVIYIELGILYESFIHPITILSGLPSAVFGALLIYSGCMLRFRPIMMTTVAALFGTLSIALGYGEGAVPGGLTRIHPEKGRDDRFCSDFHGCGERQRGSDSDHRQDQVGGTRAPPRITRK